MNPDGRYRHDARSMPPRISTRASEPVRFQQRRGVAEARLEDGLRMPNTVHEAFAPLACAANFDRSYRFRGVGTSLIATDDHDAGPQKSCGVLFTSHVHGFGRQPVQTRIVARLEPVGDRPGGNGTVDRDNRSRRQVAFRLRSGRHPSVARERGVDLRPCRRLGSAPGRG